MKFLKPLGLLTLLAGCSQQPALMEAPKSFSLIGGEYVSEADLAGKSTIAIFSTHTNSKGERFYNKCGAVIASESAVITAAHCVDPTNFVSVESTLVFNRDLEDLRTEVHTRKSNTIIIHPAYNSAQNTSDIAVIQFTGGLPAGYSPATISLDPIPLEPGDSVRILGYGINDELSGKSDNRLRTAVVDVDGVSETSGVSLRQQPTYGSTCFGDSGSPSFFEYKDQLVAWGVASTVRGRMGYKCNFRSFYMPFWMFKDFIKENLSL
ncbi:S1 family peptidase [Bdellovibrio sp.]|uniref:S1 family peptidase n=1 Tax=Bdellovibrio sp. TaxID=28201 RepID=UPI0039E4AAFA